MKKSAGKRNSQRSIEVTFLGKPEKVPAKFALDMVLRELEKKPGFRLPLDFSSDLEISRVFHYDRLRTKLNQLSEDERETGIDQNWSISIDELKSFAASVGVELVLEFHEKIPLPELEPVTPVAQLTREELAKYSLPVKVKQKKKKVSTARSFNLDRELFMLRKLQRSLTSSVMKDSSDLDEADYEDEMEQTREEISRRILRVSEHIPGILPSKPISRLAVELGWAAYLETNQPPDAHDVLRRMHELATQDTGHECLLTAVSASDGLATVEYQGGARRYIYNHQSCYKTLKEWWDSYTKI